MANAAIIVTSTMADNPSSAYLYVGGVVKCLGYGGGIPWSANVSWSANQATVLSSIISAAVDAANASGIVIDGSSEKIVFGGPTIQV